MRIRLVGLNTRFIHSCLALFCIRNELERQCPAAEIDIYQGAINDNYHQILLRLIEGPPDALLFSAAIWNSDLVRRLIVDCVSLLPGIAIVVGGTQAGEVGRLLTAGYATVVRGEIEAIGAGFYADLLNGRLQPHYAGSFLRMEYKRLDFPYRDDDFRLHLQYRHIYYFSTSRSLPTVSATKCWPSWKRSALAVFNSR